MTPEHVSRRTVSTVMGEFRDPERGIVLGGGKGPAEIRGSDPEMTVHTVGKEGNGPYARYG